MKRLILLVASLFGAAAMASAQVPAFPGAMGSGATAQAGMGGPVYNVTSLSDASDPSCVPFNDPQKGQNCTFRDCYVNMTGPRYCIPRVSGVINTGASDLRTSHGGVYYAGQAGPGGGIKIAGSGAIIWSSASDVVVRYISYDGNSSQNGPSDGSVSFDIGGGNVQRVIYDHFTFFHITNKGALALCNDAGLVGNATFQFSLIFTPDRNHPVGPMADATTCPGGAIKVENIDYIGNLIAVTDHRMPLFNVHSGRWVNNMVWNWGWFAGLWQGGTHPDIIGNTYKHGNLNSGDNGGHPHQFEFSNAQSTDDQSRSMPGPPSIYMAGNIGVQQPDPGGNQSLLSGLVTTEGGSEVGPIPASWWRPTQLPAPPVPINIIPAENYDSVYLQTVGNSQGLDCLGHWFMRRQTEDQQILALYEANANASLWVAPPGYVTAPIPPGPAACVESMHDGLPDAWKQAKGLSTTDPTIYKAIDLGTGLRNLDLYLSGGAVNPPPTNPACFGTNNCPVGTAVAVMAGPVAIRKAPVNGIGGAQVGTAQTGQAGVIASTPVASTSPTFQWVLVNFGAGPCTTAGPFTATCGYLGNDNLTPSGTPPPPTPPTVACSPTSVQTGKTSTCTSNQSVTWSATAGSITPAGLFTAPATAQTVMTTGTNANGKGSTPITVTAVPPPPVQYPTVTFTIGIPPGPLTSYTCTANSSGVYTCAPTN